MTEVVHCDVCDQIALGVVMPINPEFKGCLECIHILANMYGLQIDIMDVINS